jgi:hypothetical protein
MRMHVNRNHLHSQSILVAGLKLILEAVIQNLHEMAWFARLVPSRDLNNFHCMLIFSDITS